MRENKIQVAQCHMSIKTIIENTIYFFVLSLLIVTTISILYQTMFFPGKIPDIFGIKMFIIFDEQQVEDLKYGDLVITKNIEAKKLKIGDVVAFRDGSNMVTLNKLENIENVSEEKIEGLLIHRIAKIGSVLYFISQPLAMIGISCAIVLTGLIFYYIAYRLDERDKKISKQTEQT